MTQVMDKSRLGEVPANKKVSLPFLDPVIGSMSVSSVHTAKTQGVALRTLLAAVTGFLHKAGGASPGYPWMYLSLQQEGQQAVEIQLRLGQPLSKLRCSIFSQRPARLSSRNVLWVVWAWGPP